MIATGALDEELQRGKLLDTDSGLRPECPHCLYNGGDEPRTSQYPFLLFENVVIGRTLSMDRPGDPLWLDEAVLTSDAQGPQSPRFTCGDCEGNFVLSAEDLQRFTESGVGY
ncbi:MAG TPA: hypothetical protein VK416_10250 [Thermoanaerobaculia bacterium]|nr:hypothetical protein [Thermoanaerobaculia bacterium]